MDLPYPVWGLVGGTLAELARWYGIREKLHEGRPVWATPGYWMITGLMVMAGAALVLMHEDSGVNMNSVLAVNLGASAPTILSAMLSSAPATQKVESAPLAPPE